MEHQEKRQKDYLALMGGDSVKATFGNVPKTKSTKPLINEKTTGGNTFSLEGFTNSGLPQQSNSPVTYNELWEWFTRSPECIAPVDTIVTDIISDGYKIKPVNDKDKASVKRAEEFLEANHFKTRVLPGLLYDELVTGDAYLYKTKVTEKQVRDAVKAIARKLPLKNKKNMEQYLYYTVQDEDIYRTKQLINIASSSITIQHDMHGNVQKYLQKVGGEEAEFTPAEVIHFKYMNMNGKVYSFCPMKAILPEVTLASSIKDNAGNTFDNGGVPAAMFNLPEEVPQSPNVKFLQEELEKFRQNINKHRNLVTTGKVEMASIQNMTKDMEYRELLEQVTRIIYTVWGVPPSKMGQQGQDSGAYDSGLATEQYYRRINNLQDKNYGQVNSQLMIPEFKVYLVPNKAYLQDELKETQMVKQKMDIAQQAKNNNWWNEEAIVDYLDIPESYKGTFEEREMSNPFRQGDLKKQDVEGNTTKQELNKMKSQKQKENAMQVKATKREKEAIAFNESL